MVCDPPLKVTVTLSEDEKKVIYTTVMENHFFELKENMSSDLVGVRCQPSSSLKLQVTLDKNTKTVKFECGYPENDPDYLKLKNIADTIQRIISQKEKEMAIPQPICGYL